jgi:hypothetical protein
LNGENGFQENFWPVLGITAFRLTAVGGKFCHICASYPFIQMDTQAPKVRKLQLYKSV